MSLSRLAGATMPPVSGPLPQPVVRAFHEGLFSLPERPDELGTSVVQTVWNIPVILVAFSDSVLTHEAGEFDTVLFDTTQSTATGSVFDYYRWVSGSRLTIRGQVVATVTLPKTRAFYGSGAWGLNTNNTPGNAYGAVLDALNACEDNFSVNWSDFDMDHDGYVDMVWVVHAGIGGEATDDRSSLWSITSRMAYGWRNGTYFITNDPAPGTGDQNMRVDRFTILPELSPFRSGAISEIGIYCHEFGHALGLPDLYDTSGFTEGPSTLGPGNWSLMSSGAYGGDGQSPQTPSHLGAWPLQFLGWDQTLQPAQDTTLALEPIARNGSIIEWWFQGESYPEHFLIEHRRREGFDTHLFEEGLLITHVNEAVIGRGLPTNTINSGPDPGLWLVEADGHNDLVVGNNRGDYGDPFPGATGRTFMDDETQPSTRTFRNAVTNLAIEDIAPIGDRMSFRLQVRAPGWGPVEDYTLEEFQPYDYYGSARVSAIDDRGIGYVAGSELRAGRPQVVLRSGRNSWGPAFQVSNSPTAAIDPALALVPGGDPVIVWAESRGGRSELYFRSRIQGIWTQEQRLLSLPGDCRNPAIGIDGRGNVYLAFKYVKDDLSQIGFMRFTYFSPFGQPVMITGSQNRPGSPSIAVGADGLTYVIWPEQGTTPQRLRFASYRPGAGVSSPQELTQVPQNAQTSPSAVIDAQGTLHVVWHASGPGINEIHYQRRTAGGGAAPLDSLIESQGELLQDAFLAVDRDGDLHLVFEAWRSGYAQIFYRRRQADLGWDARSTELTPGGQGVVARPQALPTSSGNLSVAYLGYPDGRAHFMVRRRTLSGGPLFVAPPPALPAGIGLSLGPNPLRPGQTLEIRWSGPDRDVPPMIEFFDLSGRRVAEVGLERRSGTWAGLLPASLTHGWSPGIYFARSRASRAGALRLVVIR